MLIDIKVTRGPTRVLHPHVLWTQYCTVQKVFLVQDTLNSKDSDPRHPTNLGASIPKRKFDDLTYLQTIVMLSSPNLFAVLGCELYTHNKYTNHVTQKSPTPFTV